MNLVLYCYICVQVLNFKPAMLMEETKAAARARLSGREEGVRPPPISTRPPTAVRPERKEHLKKKKVRTQCHKERWSITVLN